MVSFAWDRAEVGVRCGKVRIEVDHAQMEVEDASPGPHRVLRVCAQVEEDLVDLGGIGQDHGGGGVHELAEVDGGGGTPVGGAEPPHHGVECHRPAFVVGPAAECEDLPTRSAARVAAARGPANGFARREVLGCAEASASSASPE